MKVWIMCCLNLGSMLNIYKILLNFLHFAQDFEQNILNCTREWDSTKNVLISKCTAISYHILKRSLMLIKHPN